MAGSASPLTLNLISNLDALVSLIFQSVDDGVSRDAARIFAETECELVSLVAELRRRHAHQRNLRQPLCRLPTEMLTKALSSLSAKDQLSIMRVCQDLRAHALDTPGLWTNVDRVQNPTALSFVLERANKFPIDIANLFVNGPNDVRFVTVASHMYHIRTLCLHLSNGFTTILPETRAFAVFATSAPILHRLSFHASKAIGTNTTQPLHPSTSLTVRSMPRLSSVQFHGVDPMAHFIQNLQGVESFFFSCREDSRYLGPAVAENVSQLLRNLTTVNLELASWNAAAGSPEFGPAVRRINIRWTKPGPLVPRDAIPNRKAWETVRIIHVAQVCNTSGATSGVLPTPTIGAIPETTAPYRNLSVRTSRGPNTCVHMRVTDREDRERIFCGLQPDTVAGMVTHIPGSELSAVTVSTTAVALRVISDAQYPALKRLCLVLDTDGVAWMNILARDMLSITTLERLEFSQETGATPFTWSTTLIMCVLACCIAAGNKIQEAVFLGFEPEAQCVALAGVFTHQVVVDREWREPESESKWFTELPFEWY